MSLRANPPKKELFEQDVHRPAKRLKTVHSPHLSPQAPKPRYKDIFPKLNIEKTKSNNDNSFDQSQSRSLPENSVSTFEKSESSVYVDTLNLVEVPADAALQVTWIAEAVRTLARRAPPTGNAIPIILSSSNSCDIVCGPGFRPTGFTGFNQAALHIRRKKLINIKPDHTIPRTVLDSNLEDRLFRSQRDGHDAKEQRSIWGRQLISAIRQGSYAYDQTSADNLRMTVLNSQDPYPFLAALEALANQSDVSNAIRLNLQYSSGPFGNPERSSSNQGASSTTDGEISNLSTPTETLRSQSTEATSVTSVTSRHEGRPRDLIETRLLNSVSSGLSPCRNVEMSDFQAIVDRARQSATNDALAHRQYPENEWCNINQSADPIVNALNRACAAMYEMATGQPGLYRTMVDHAKVIAHQSQKSTYDSGSSLRKPSPETEVHVGSPNAVQINEVEQGGASNARARIEKANEAGSSDGRAGLPFVRETAQKDLGLPVPQGRPIDDDETITEARIDGILALANGGNLEIQDSDSETEPDLSFDSERTISRPLTPETVIDRHVTSLFDGIITELMTNTDHGHGLAFQHPRITYYQSAHYQRLASTLQHCVMEIQPKVNVIMSTEQADATKAFYKHLERRVTRPTDVSLYPHSSPAWPHNPAPMFQIQPPPGFEIRWHTPCTPPMMSVFPHDLSDAPGLVPSDAVLSSNATSLPKLAPKPKRTSNELGEAFGLPPFPSDPIVEARARLKKGFGEYQPNTTKEARARPENIIQTSKQPGEALDLPRIGLDPAAEARARLKKRLEEFQSNKTEEIRARRKKRIQKPRQKKAWTFATPRLPVKKAVNEVPH